MAPKSNEHSSAPRNPARRPGRPAGGLPVITRDQALQATLRAIRRSGFSVTMDEIADEAGVSKPIIYRTLGSKEEVAEAVAEHLSHQVGELTRQYQTGLGPMETFRQTVTAFLELLAEEREVFQFVQYGWGFTGNGQLERMIERSAAPFMQMFSAIDGNRTLHPSATAKQTWGYAGNGVLRDVATMWVNEPYCSVEELVDQLSVFISGAFGIDKT